VVLRIAIQSLTRSGATSPFKSAKDYLRYHRKTCHRFSPTLYRERNRVERFFNRLKHCRRVATRYEKLAATFLAMIKLAAIRLWLRMTKPVNESTT